MQPMSAQDQQRGLQRPDRAHGLPRAQRLHGRAVSLQSACWILVPISSRTHSLPEGPREKRALVGLWPWPTWEPILHPEEDPLS